MQTMPKLKPQKTPTMEELLSEVKLPSQSLRRGDVIEGKVVAVSEDEALIDIGAKSEGILRIGEFKDRSLTVGDKILVYVLTPEDKEGQIRLSLKKAKTAKAWLDLEEAAQEGTILEALISGHNKGGLTVDILDLKGFIPFSQLENLPDLSLPRPELQSQLDRLRGNLIKAVCLEADPTQDRIILSERLALQAQEVEEKRQALVKVSLGQELKGKVVNIFPYGLGIEAEGVGGLVETSEIAWEAPEEVLTTINLGDEVSVKVIFLDEATGKVKFSIKQTKKDPWREKVSKLKVDSKVKGEVTKISSLGITLLVEKGVEGILSLSEIPSDLQEVKIGEAMEAVIGEIDQENRRLILKMG